MDGELAKTIGIAVAAVLTGGGGMFVTQQGQVDRADTLAAERAAQRDALRVSHEATLLACDKHIQSLNDTIEDYREELQAMRLSTCPDGSIPIPLTEDEYILEYDEGE